MAHKPLIDGTAYEISGGKTLVGGTAYSIKNGKTLVGGTAYEVGFGTMVTVAIGQNAMANNYLHSSAKINGQVYDGTELVELIVPIGTIIECSVSKKSTSATAKATVSVNDTTVLENTEVNVPLVYNHIVDSTTSLLLGCYAFMASSATGMVTIYDDGIIGFVLSTGLLKAQEGMTWEQWINSEMCTATTVAVGDGIVTYTMSSSTYKAVNPDGTAVKPTDIIKPACKYGVALIT